VLGWAVLRLPQRVGLGIAEGRAGGSVHKRSVQAVDTSSNGEGAASAGPSCNRDVTWGSSQGFVPVAMQEEMG
jgi:hypothetical protein